MDRRHPAPALGRTTLGISAITALARTLGFARWIVFGVTVGATFLGNTYQTANWAPNILFEMVAGGVLAAVFVPTFVAELERSAERADGVASTIFNLFALLVAPLVIAGMVWGRTVMGWFTAGVADPVVRAREIEVGAYFLLFFLPQTFLYVAGMVMRGLSHAHQRFLLPAAAPAVQSVVLIGTYVWFRALGHGTLEIVSDAQLLVLAAGTTAAVVAWTVAQWPTLVSVGARYRPVLWLSDPGVRRAVRAGGFGVAYYIVTQLGFVATLVMANRIEGGVVAFLIAFAFYELPNAVGGFPIATASFPSLARHHVRGETAAFGDLLSRSLRAQLLLLAPAATAAYVVGPAAVEWVFSFGGAQARPALVGVTVQSLALGLPAYAALQVLVRAFYARNRTGPPVVANVACVAVFLPLALALWGVGDTAGMRALGFGHAAGQWAAVAVAVVPLARAGGWAWAADVRFMASIVLRVTPVGVVMWIVLDTLGRGLGGIIVSGVCGVVLYGLLVARRPEVRDVRGLLRRQR